MRITTTSFAVAIISVASFGAASLGATAQTPDQLKPQSDPYAEYESLKSSTAIAIPRYQKGRQTGNLRTPDTVVHDLFSRRLGEISAITGAANTLYVADKASGQIFRIMDRNGDGRQDGVRPLPHRFDAPSGLAVLGGTLYVADRSGVWRVQDIGTPTLLAGLTNAGSTGRHILRKDPAGDALWLGLTTQDGQAKLLSLSTVTGQATLLDQTAGQLLDISEASGPRPWLFVQKDGVSYLGPSTDLLTDMGREPGHIWLPQGTGSIPNWPAKYAQHAMISRSVSGDVVMVPSLLTRPLPVGQSVFSGFRSSTGRTAWGQLGPIYADARGVFVADTMNGDIWILRGQQPKPKVIEPARPDDVDAVKDGSVVTREEEFIPEADEEPINPFASSIKEISTIKRGSMLDKGSMIEPSSREKDTSKTKDKSDKD
ncbi:hypothetical protein ACJ3XI_10205 [Litorimonas sp. RW-G-Af-16]|uniref:hypothetical protein n=1 Tax=Litorimonas sp. RW-G-Af-16 TaxID=3241168 RepID=UPI00390CA82F